MKRYVAPITGDDQMCPGATLETHPLKGAPNTKDWFRLLHKASNDTLSPRDVSKCSEQQLDFFMPLLLQLSHLPAALFARLNDSRFLRSSAFYWMQGAPLTIHSTFSHNNALRQALNEEFGATVSYFQAMSVTVAMQKEGATATFPPDPEMVSPFLEPIRDQAPFTSDDALDEVDSNQGHLTGLTIGKTCKSGHSPIFLDLQDGVKKKKILLKPDTVLTDALVYRFFELFNYFWRMSWIPAEVKPAAISFAVATGGPSWGFVEVIPNAIPLRNFDFDKILTFSDSEMNTFLRTCAGGMIAGYLLGLGDRHSDNTMIVDGNKLMHIDFKHCFDHKTTGVDAPCIAIPMKMKKALVQKQKWNEFKDLCANAFAVIRRNNGWIVALCRSMFAGVVDSNEVEQSLLSKFQLGILESRAIANIPGIVEAGVYSLKRVLKDAVHEISLKRMEDDSRGAASSSSASVSSAAASTTPTVPTTPPLTTPTASTTPIEPSPHTTDETADQQIPLSTAPIQEPITSVSTTTLLSPDTPSDQQSTGLAETPTATSASVHHRSSSAITVSTKPSDHKHTTSTSTVSHH
ncbi:Phosphatidylinositol 3-kinase 1 [Pelomyxa schiedti]|nr:Phosphatidylinositol 3-kinase 1 [Pelomyxa schiedti]